jgi:glyoxylate/hydroxypyruvate reductase A
MSILLNNHGYDNNSWYLELQSQLPNTTIYQYEHTKNLDVIANDIEYAVIWNHPKNDLQRYPNLKGILLLGAGTEHIDADINVPDVPIVRLIDPEVLKDMGLYTLYWVMNQQRLYDIYRQQQQQKHWKRHNIGQPKDYKICVLGLGAVGKEVANRLHLNGFNVSGWDAFEQTINDIPCSHGKETLFGLLPQSDILVNCLPLNSHTKHFISSDVLNALPNRASLINISRGDIIDDIALLSALNNKTIAHAILDTFSTEPLPPTSPYWAHPNVTITPHISGATYARSAAQLIAANIQRIEQGEAPFPLHCHPSRTMSEK